VNGKASPDTILRDILQFVQSATATPLVFQRIGWTRIIQTWNSPPTGAVPDKEEFVFLNDEELRMQLGEFAGIWRRADQSRKPDDPVLLLASAQSTSGVTMSRVRPLIRATPCRRHPEVFNLFHEGKMISMGMPLPVGFSWAAQPSFSEVVAYANIELATKREKWLAYPSAQAPPGNIMLAMKNVRTFIHYWEARVSL
jgi:hypothetical protein